MSGSVIYHGTPLTPRAALNAVLPGRAACVSFFRPDDLEPVLAVCPQVMFRSRGIFVLDAGHARREGVGRGRPTAMVAGLLRLAGTYPVHAGAMGDHAGQPCRTVPAQRRVTERLAVRSSRGTGLAHGRTDRATGEAVRTIPARLRRVDRRPEARASRVRGLSSQDGRGCAPHGQCLASAAHAPGNRRRMGLSLCQCRQHQPCAEWSSL